MQRFSWAAVVGMLLVFCFVGLRAQENNSETYRQLHLFGEVFERVRADYVEKVSDSKLVESAINGMLTSLDPHSGFLNKENFRDMQVHTKGEFGGLGIEVTMDNGLVKVVSPIDDTPAFHAGIKSGDLIFQLDDEPVMGITLAEAVDRMRGRVGTDIKLTIRRDGQEPFDVTITRAIITIQSVRSRIEKDIGYVRITTFNEQAADGLKKAVKGFRNKLGDKLKGIVLDLRNNPGGLLEQAVAVSDSFLERGEIVSTRGRHKDDDNRYNAHPGDLTDGLPVVVLINGGSASASEIVAGALQNHHRAVIMGTRSFGTGSVQTIIPTGSLGAIRLTTALYYTPSGVSIQAKGIEPSIVVEQARFEAIDGSQRRREENLRGALENENAKPTENKVEATVDASTDGEAESFLKDYQLARALDLLHGIALYEDQIAN